MRALLLDPFVFRLAPDPLEAPEGYAPEAPVRRWGRGKGLRQGLCMVLIAFFVAF